MNNISNKGLPNGVYISRMGKQVNMASIIAANDKTVAVGNAKLNARGDMLGKNGTIIKTSEEIVQEYNTTSKQAVENYSIKGNELPKDFFVTPQVAVQNLQKEISNMSTQQQEEKPKQNPDQRKRKIIETDE